MRQLTKQESKLYLSWYRGFIIGFREAYDRVPANTGDAWNNLGFFKKRKYQKTEFNKGYNDGHKLYLRVVGKPWDEINPDIYKEWYREHWLYNHVYGGKE